MYIIGGGRLITFDEGSMMIENGALAVDGSTIVDVGTTDSLLEKYTAEFIDARGGVIMPGFINAHTHFYSYLGRGMALPGYYPRNHYEALKGRSWKLDRNLAFFDSIYAAFAAIIESIKCGVTTVFDHHAANSGAAGTLLGIAGAVEDTGIRACLSYEVSYRCGFKASSEGIAENEEFLTYCESIGSDRIKAAFGLHAPFTLSDLDLDECVRRCDGRTGFHIHVSESPADTYFCQHSYGLSPVARLKSRGILGERTIAAHCVHVTPEEIGILRETGTVVVNNPQSNMSNAVGCAPVLDMLKAGVTVGLGTDAFTSDMLESARAFICAQRQKSCSPAAGVNEAGRLLFDNNRLLASRYFGSGIGQIKNGAPADVVILEHKPFTPMDESNLLSHIFFGMSGRDCSFNMVNGRILMRDRKLLCVEEDKLRDQITESAKALWDRIKDRDYSPYEWSSPVQSYH